jgi:hypothetical protein
MQLKQVKKGDIMSVHKYFMKMAKAGAMQRFPHSAHPLSQLVVPALHRVQSDRRNVYADGQLWTLTSAEIKQVLSGLQHDNPGVGEERLEAGKYVPAFVRRRAKRGSDEKTPSQAKNRQKS